MFTKHTNIPAIVSAIASLDGTAAPIRVDLSVIRDGEYEVEVSVSADHNGTHPGIAVFAPIANWISSTSGVCPSGHLFVYDIDVADAEHADHVSGHFDLTVVVGTISAMDVPQSAFLIAIAGDAESALQWKLAFDGTTNIPKRPSHWPNFPAV